MSGVVSSIGKVFKPVLDVTKRVILPVAAVGAALFTGGMALGGTGLASGASAMGGPLGNMLTTAVTRAGIGAIAGSITGAGAGQGAMIGALSGAGESALRGGIGAAMGGGRSMAMQEAMSTSNFGGSGGGIGAAMRGAEQAGQELIGSQFGTPPRSAVNSSMVSDLATPTNEGGFFKSVPGGSMIAGLGQGLSAYMQAKQQADLQKAQIDAQRERQQAEFDFLNAKEDRQRAAYRVDPSVHHGAAPRYRFDPTTGQVVQG